MCCVKRLLDLLTLLYTLQKCPIQPLPLLVQDALNEIARQRSKDLFKPLRVHFIGEDGIDAGGVKKEFFQLLMTELLSPDYGMLVFQPVSQPTRNRQAASGVVPQAESHTDEEAVHTDLFWPLNTELLSPG